MILEVRQYRGLSFVETIKANKSSYIQLYNNIWRLKVIVVDSLLS